MNNSKINAFIVFYSGIELFIFGGIIFGWSSLVYIFKREGILRNNCPNSTSFLSNSTTIRCDDQEKKFAFIFTISICLGGISGILAGFILDRYGQFFIGCLYK